MEITDKVNQPRLSPIDQFPKEAITESVAVQPPPNSGGQWNGSLFTLNMASAADSIIEWGKNTKVRDQKLRNFWPTESYLAGAITSVSFRNATSDWEIKHTSDAVVKSVTDMLNTAIAGDTFGWNPFVNRFSQDLYTQDNGAFIELIRDPGVDANSKFKGPMAPVIGIGNLDSNQCMRTGNIEYPVIYTDRESKEHKLRWYEVIPFSEYPSAIEKMNGVGYCGVTRALRLSQIIRSIMLFKDEEVSGTNVKKIHIIGGVGRVQIDDAVKRTLENTANKGNARLVEHAILASIDPEKPVSAVTVDLAGLPEGFNFDQEMQWYISGLALALGVDYQEFAPLPGGNIGSGAQSNMLARKSSGKGPRNWMDSITGAFTYYGVIPRGATLSFNDKNEEEEMEKQAIRTKALEEAAIAVNSKILTPEAAVKSLVRRGIYVQEDIDNIPAEWWTIAMDTARNESKKQLVGSRGGNTIGEDAQRQNTGKPNQTGGARLRKETDLQEANIFNKALDTISSLFKSKKPDNTNVTVHNHPSKPANVTVKPAQTVVKNFLRPTPINNYVRNLIPKTRIIDKTTTVVQPATVIDQTKHIIGSPNVTIENKQTIKVPKIKRVTGEMNVNRDRQNNIEGNKTVENYEYEE